MRRFLATAIVLFALAAPAPAAGAWTWPVSGEVVTAYRNSSDPYAGGQHRGIDIAAAAGTQVRAAAAGTVTFTGIAGSSGLTVAVRTADGRFDTSYLHLSSASVAKGDRVEAGVPLGEVGTSGRRSAVQPHLHFGVREAGSRHAYRDPLTLLPAAPAPVREGPRGVPVPAPGPVRAAPRRARVPRAAPPRRRRVPAGRRVRVPVRSPKGLPRQPTLGPRPVAPAAAPRRVGSPAPRRRPVPRLGPRPLPSRAPARPAPEPSPRPRSDSEAVPPDLGMAAACLGLLLAAACLGGSRERGAGGRAPVRTLLRPLTGRQ